MRDSLLFRFVFLCVFATLLSNLVTFVLFGFVSLSVGDWVQNFLQDLFQFFLGSWVLVRLFGFEPSVVDGA